uniref:Uncharacterized protein n=1 Tax=Lepeophtheirus salmonis TaxID=72036 RepID=A0A0K2VB37_LEPSM
MNYVINKIPIKKTQMETVLLLYRIGLVYWYTFYYFQFFWNKV